MVLLGRCYGVARHCYGFTWGLLWCCYDVAMVLLGGC